MNRQGWRLKPEGASVARWRICFGVARRERPRPRVERPRLRGGPRSPRSPSAVGGRPLGCRHRRSSRSRVQSRNPSCGETRALSLGNRTRSRHKPLASCRGVPYHSPFRARVPAPPGRARSPVFPIPIPCPRDGEEPKTHEPLDTQRRLKTRPGVGRAGDRRGRGQQMGLALRRQVARAAGRRSRSASQKGTSHWEVKDGMIEGSGTQSMLYELPGRLQELPLPRRVEDQRPRQLGYVYPHAQGGDVLQGLRDPGQQLAHGPRQDGLALYLRAHLQAARPSGHVLHAGDRGEGRDVPGQEWSRRSRSRSTILYDVTLRVLRPRPVLDRRALLPSSSIDPGSKVTIRKIEVIELPDTKEPAKKK